MNFPIVVAEGIDPLMPSLEEVGANLDPDWSRRRGSVHDRCMQAILDRDDTTDVELLSILAAEDWKRGSKAL